MININVNIKDAKHAKKSHFAAKGLFVCRDPSAAKKLYD